MHITQVSYLFCPCRVVSYLYTAQIKSWTCAPACLWREQSRALRIEAIKSQILSKLRLKQAPNISRDTVNQLLPKAPPLQQLLDMYGFQGDQTPLGNSATWDEDDYHATAETIIIMASEPEGIVQTEGKPKCCFFKFTPKTLLTKVVKAHLWVFLKPVERPTTVFIQILRLLPIFKGGTARIRSLKSEVTSRQGQWQSIDFKLILHNWFQHPESNWGVEIRAVDDTRCARHPTIGGIQYIMLKDCFILIPEYEFFFSFAQYFNNLQILRVWIAYRYSDLPLRCLA
uniref:TGF-beta propeptide domain-containing protein n=1 Tax=Eptatretus burgeri TaxID=7764 RepID=A0A8C4Q8S8_EPTBU